MSMPDDHESAAATAAAGEGRPGPELRIFPEFKLLRSLVRKAWLRASRRPGSSSPGVIDGPLPPTNRAPPRWHESMKWRLVIQCLFLAFLANPAAAARVAVLMSSNAGEYEQALRGFK